MTADDESADTRILDPAYAYEADWDGVATTHPMTDVIPIHICPVCRREHSGVLEYGQRWHGVRQIVVEACQHIVNLYMWALVPMYSHTTDGVFGPQYPEKLEWRRRREEK